MSKNLLKRAFRKGVQRSEAIRDDKKAARARLKNHTAEAQATVSEWIEHWLTNYTTGLRSATGLRRGEIINLKWENVNLTNRKLEVVKSKTDAGIRSVDIGRELVAAFNQHRVNLASVNTGLVAFAAPVFPGVDGERLSRKFGTVARRLGMPPGCSLHWLRHFHATILLNATIPLTVIAERLGHADASVPTSAIGEFRDRLLKSGVSITSTRKILATLRSALSYAMKEKNWLAVNPALGVEVIGTAGEGPKKRKAPTKEQLKAIFANAPDDLKLKIMFAAFTGLRASEQWGLTWEQVDLETGQVHVVRRLDSYGIVGPTKSKAGVRDVPLSALMVRLLKEHWLKSAYSEDADFVFTNAMGKHTSHDNLMKRAYIPLLEKAEKAVKLGIGEWTPTGVDEDGETVMKFVPSILWHSLRHFAVSTWIEQGLAPKTVQTYAGHSSIVITLDRYGHLFENDQHKTVMDRIADELMG